jgi:RNA polymerase sigma-70 factor (ECF subfamily)
MTPEFSDLLTEVQPRLYAFIFGLIPNKPTAEDVLQETNKILCEKADTYDPGKQFSAWAFTIARYQILAATTKHKRNRLVFSPDLVESLADDLEEELVDYDKQRKKLKACLPLLKPRVATVMRMKYTDGMRIKDIADELNLKESNISAILQRARKTLEKCTKRNLYTMTIDTPDAESALKIVDADIGPMPTGGLFDPLPKVKVELEDGTEKVLFQFYPDEISFKKDELLGLTESEARRLFHDKDLQYLQT